MIKVYILFFGIRALFLCVTRGYGDHSPLTESWKALDVLLCRCTCRIDEDVSIGRCKVAAV
jgi:hypothetical protein